VKNYFTIRSHRNSDNLHLQLKGDFDEAAAQTLLDELKKDQGWFDKIFIHTNSLGEVWPEGCKKLKDNIIEISDTSAKLVFTGDKGIYLAPDGKEIF